jgi:ribosome-associated toxin RatA of RatAB toxin-antitoxin module
MFCVLLISPLSDLFAESGVEDQTVWSEYRSKSGIQGYERNIPGTKYIETRSVTIIDKPIDLLWGILKDIESYPEWMYRCTDAELLSQTDDLNRVLYFSQGVPFGSPDRQVITQAITTRNDQSDSYSVRVISLDHANYNLSSDLNTTDRQWMNEFRGRWILQRQDDGRSKVTYRAFTDPGGFAPAFIVNRVIRNVTFNSLAGMIKRSTELNRVNRNHDDDELRTSARINNASREKSLD